MTDNEDAHIKDRQDRFAIPEDGGVIQADEKPHWKGQLLERRNGTLEPDSVANCILILQFHPHYRGVFVQDQFSDQIIVHRCPPWEKESKFRVHRLENNDIVKCTAALEYMGLKLPHNRVTNAIEVAAENCAIHPMRAYFDRIKWDGFPRLKTWLIDYANATQQPPEYTAAVGTKWMVAAVRRIYYPGAKFDHMLVLEGAQNIGKSRILRTLATIGPANPKEGEETEFFTDAIRFEMINEPSAIITMQGKLIIEFSELAGMSRKEIEEVKNWITIEKDEVQKKYKNQITTYPRQFILAGTTNESAWLRDPTGNRRFLPVKCGNQKFNIEGLRAVREQLWAEAVHLHKEGFATMIDHGSDLEAMAASEQASRMIEDVWAEPILSAIKDMRCVTTNEILQLITVDIARRDELSARRVSRILRAAQWEQKQDWIHGRNVKRWQNPRFFRENMVETMQMDMHGNIELPGYERQPGEDDD